MIYGSTGYSGELVARRAVQAGLRPILAGRSAEKVRRQAAALGLEHRVFGLDDPARIAAELPGIGVVLHCAGPFVHTAAPMAAACLLAGSHYVDIAGEFPVFEALMRQDGAARAAGITLLPGAGFDVVPTDCLAAHVQRRLPGATRLALALCHGRGGSSQGTARSSLEIARLGGRVRREGELVPTPLGVPTRRIDPGDGLRSVAPLALAELSAIYWSTGVPHIDTYMALSPGLTRLVGAFRRLGWLLRQPWAMRLLQRQVRAQAPGPTAAERAQALTTLWVEATDAAGRSLVSTMHVRDPYGLTAETAVAIVQRLLAGGVPTGFQTPASAFGPDFALEFAGVSRHDQ